VGLAVLPSAMLWVTNPQLALYWVSWRPPQIFSPEPLHRLNGSATSRMFSGGLFGVLIPDSQALQVFKQLLSNHLTSALTNSSQSKEFFINLVRISSGIVRGMLSFIIIANLEKSPVLAQGKSLTE